MADSSHPESGGQDGLSGGSFLSILIWMFPVLPTALYPSLSLSRGLLLAVLSSGSVLSGHAFDANPNSPPAVRLFEESFDQSGLAPLDKGPRPPVYPDFTPDNQAAFFDENTPARPLAGKETHPGLDLDFRHGDSISVVFWLAAKELPVGEPVYLLSKGHPAKAGQPDDDLNYAVMVIRRTERAEIQLGFAFASETGDPESPRRRHQWWSGNMPLDPYEWHQFGLTFTFGDPTSLLPYQNGRNIPFSGNWQSGHSTERGPVTNDEPLVLGGCFDEKTKASYRGRLDRLAIHRGIMREREFDAGYGIRTPLPAIDLTALKPDAVRVELCAEGVPPRRQWPEQLPKVAQTMDEDAFGFFELPYEYTRTGVRAARAGVHLLRASASMTFPRGRHRLLLRARGVSRLMLDQRIVLETELQPTNLNGHHLTTDQESYLDLGPDFRFAPPGNREGWCHFESDGETPLLVVLETIFGTERPGLGETAVAWSREGEETWQLVAPKRHVPYTDAGWAEYEAERRAHLAAINRDRRRAAFASQRPYWERRREAAREWLDRVEPVAIPSLPDGYPAHNPIDHFLAAKIERVRPAIEQAQAGEGPDYFKEIRPLLETRCYDCHQGGKSKGGLRLDLAEAARRGGKSDGPAVVPGDAETSALVARIRSDDPDEIMPPNGSPLTEDQIRLLEAWIGNGANWPELQVTQLELPPLADDLTVLRRITLDTVGVPPSEEEIGAYLADAPGERRGRAMERLFQDPRRADHWMGYWQDVLAENPNLLSGSLNNTGPFRFWLHEALVDDKPLDVIVTELIRMEGDANNGGPAGFATAGQNDSPFAEKGLILAGAFLGVEMKCARCHDSPSHESRQEDLFKLAAMLNRGPLVVPETSSVPMDKLSAGGRKPLIQVTLAPGSKVEPVWPFPQFVDAEAARPLAEHQDSPRDLLAAMITAPQNERFAQVVVNRVWHRLMGRGLVTQPEDWEKSETTHPELLQWLGREFVRSGYSLNAVCRLIFESHAYQRRSSPDLKAPEALYVAPAPRSMAAEQVVDSLFAATGKPFRVEELCFDLDGISSQRSMGHAHRAWMLTSTSNERDRPSLTLPRVQAVLTVLESFGWRGARQSPATVRESAPNVLQPAVLANGTMSSWVTRLSDDHALVDLALQAESPEEIVRRVYLRLLTREPDAPELAEGVELLRDGFDRRTEASETVVGKEKRKRPYYVTWSNHLDGPANALAADIEEAARRGDPPTARLEAEWREAMEDFLWILINKPETIHIR